MTVYLVTRHVGALLWLQRQYPDGVPVLRWDKEKNNHVKEGDIIIGNLPILAIYNLLRRGGRVILLMIPGTAYEGQPMREINPDEMDTVGASLLEVVEMKLRDVEIKKPKKGGPNP